MEQILNAKLENDRKSTKVPIVRRTAPPLVDVGEVGEGAVGAVGDGGTAVAGAFVVVPLLLFVVGEGTVGAVGDGGTAVAGAFVVVVVPLLLFVVGEGAVGAVGDGGTAVAGAFVVVALLLLSAEEVPIEDRNSQASPVVSMVVGTEPSYISASAALNPKKG
jgi:hypothetical protein